MRRRPSRSKARYGFSRFSPPVLMHRRAFFLSRDAGLRFACSRDAPSLGRMMTHLTGGRAGRGGCAGPVSSRAQEVRRWCAQGKGAGKGRGERARGGRLGFAASPLLSRSCSPAPAGFGFCAARCGVDGGSLPFAGVREARAGALTPESAAAANKGAAPCVGRLLRGESVVSSGCVSEPGLRARLPR